MKKTIARIITVVLVVSVFISMSFAHGTEIGAEQKRYGTNIRDEQGEYCAWVVLEKPGIPIWIGTNCKSILSQNYMIAGQYIGFHECNTFAYQIKWGYPYSQKTNAGSRRYYYKGSSSLGSTNMPYDGNVLVSPDWVWDNHRGNTDGDIVGEGYDTYYAKSESSFVCMEAVYPNNLIKNSVSMTVSQ